MIDPPEVVTLERRAAAVIHLDIPRDRIVNEIDPAIKEVLKVLADQGTSPAGPLFAHHLTRSNDRFDFEVGFPLGKPIEAQGRVKNSHLPGGRVLHTCHVGPYDALFSAWREFRGWLESDAASNMNLTRGDTLFEIYSVGPETTSDQNQWRTDLYQTLKD